LHRCAAGRWAIGTGRNFTITNGTASANNASLGDVMYQEPGSTVTWRAAQGPAEGTLECRVQVLAFSYRIGSSPSYDKVVSTICLLGDPLKARLGRCDRSSCFGFR
jgi:hypothetical protein